VATVILEDRLIEQLAPIGELLAELIDAAHSECTVQHVATAFPELRRPAHLSRLSGIAAWAHLADGLVEADRQERFPAGFSVATTDAQHNAGRYVFRFPGGVFTVRRAPHDDEKDEGLFMQESFKEVTELLDKLGATDEKEGVRVWIKMAPGGATTLTAQDRHGYQVKISLTNLLDAGLAPATPHPASSVAKTQVRSSLKPAQDAEAK